MRESIRRRLLFGVLILLVAFAASVCGPSADGAQFRLVAPKNSLPPSRVAGIGINCHSEQLPVEDLKAIGISWVRLDVPGGPETFGKIKPLVDHYRDFGQLWVLPRSAGDAAQAAKAMVDAGIAEIEVFNEPDLGRISPSSYAQSFQAIRLAVGTSARLYGPSLCTWLDRKSYLDDCIRSGFKPDAITFHGYHQRDAGQLAAWVKDIRAYGLPVVVSELGFPNYLGSMEYRVKMSDSLGSLFVKTRDALKGTPWFWYDGPNPAGDYDCGLFDWNQRTGYAPNKNYRDIAAAIAKSKG